MKSDVNLAKNALIRYGRADKQRHTPDNLSIYWIIISKIRSSYAGYVFLQPLYRRHSHFGCGIWLIMIAKQNGNACLSEYVCVLNRIGLRFIFLLTPVLWVSMLRFGIWFWIDWEWKKYQCSDIRKYASI